MRFTTSSKKEQLREANASQRARCQFGLRSATPHRILAIRLVTKVPFFDLKKQFVPLREEILSEIAAVCDDQAFILGTRVDQLEEAIAELCGGARAVGVSTGMTRNLL